MHVSGSMQLRGVLLGNVISSSTVGSSLEDLRSGTFEHVSGTIQLNGGLLRFAMSSSSVALNKKFCRWRLKVSRLISVSSMLGISLVRGLVPHSDFGGSNV